MPVRPLDDVDRDIVSLLQANAREPIVALARRVGLSRNAVQERLKRLERDGVIAAYTVRLGEPSTAAVRALMLVYLRGMTGDRVIPALSRFSEIKLCYSVSGEADMAILVEAGDLADIDRVRSEVERVTGVDRVTALVVLAERFDRR